MCNSHQSQEQNKQRAATQTKIQVLSFGIRVEVMSRYVLVVCHTLPATHNTNLNILCKHSEISAWHTCYHLQGKQSPFRFCESTVVGCSRQSLAASPKKKKDDLHVVSTIAARGYTRCACLQNERQQMLDIPWLQWSQGQQTYSASCL